MSLGAETPSWAVVPFGVLLGGIAALPLVAPHFWENNKNRGIFTAIVAAPIAAWLLQVAPHLLEHSLFEYVSFLIFIGSLYVVAGGIHVSGDLTATPRHNVGFLAIGAVLANFVGTTGASMLLIRTVLRTNGQRTHNAHLPVFFILIVSNCGGLLTPLGDPPLFLGYLRGVPFTWTFSLFPLWVVTVGYLLAVFYFFDRRAYAKEPKAAIARDVSEREPVRITGLVNLAFLAGIIGAVFAPAPIREAVMFAMALASIFLGPRKARDDNKFTYAPIIEVAILFAGIFVTMVPALELLSVRGGELGLEAPWQFFVATGTLSSMLDNAPTYLTFLSTAQALGLENEVVGIPNVFLTAISAGAVLMGANTYIGNGPNFMVKAIAEEAGYHPPHFFRYAATATAILLPVYLVIVVWL